MEEHNYSWLTGWVFFRMKPECYLAWFSDTLYEKKQESPLIVSGVKDSLIFRFSGRLQLSRDSSVGIQTRLTNIREARIWFPGRQMYYFLPHSLQTGSGAHSPLNQLVPDTQVRIKVTLRLTVLVSSPMWGPWPDNYYLCDSYGLLLVGRPLWREVGVCLLYVLLDLASAVFLGSESLGTRDHILLSHIWDFPFRRLLRLAGSRWRYSTPPPHGYTGYYFTWSKSGRVVDMMSHFHLVPRVRTREVVSLILYMHFWRGI
jgi:hypothetical protein